MKRFIKVEVSENELEELIRKAPDQIEEGLTYVDHQKSQPGGRLDVLLVDSGKALVVAELKIEQDDGMLLQGLDYYDYVTTNIEAFARVYKEKKIDPTQQARLFLVAPSFSPTLVNRSKWLDLPISIFTYISGKCEGSEDVMAIFTEQEITTPPEIIELPSLEDHLDYITDPKARKRIEGFIEEIKSWDPERISLDSIKYHLSFKIDNRLLTYLTTCRKYFIAEAYDENGEWQRYSVKSDEDLDIAREEIKAALERLLR
jgi:hypothetical protein